MKKIISFTLVLLFLSSSYTEAKALDGSRRATTLMRRMSAMTSAMAGVNGIGVTGCDPRTGEANIGNDFVHCVRISTETEEAFEALRKLFPVGSKINETFITIRYVGPIEEEPRMSVGN